MGHSKADVVATAVRVLDAHGLEHCSMRRVAAELRVQPSALYHHVPNKQQLLALMADHIIEPSGLTHTGSPTPLAEAEAGADVGAETGADRARLLSARLRTALLAVRDGAEVVATATAYRMGESALETEFARCIGEDAARTLLLYLFGHAQATQMRLQGQQFGVLPDTHSREQLDAECERGVELILAGCVAPSQYD